MSTKLIAIAAEDDKGMAGEVSHHFGRCPFYVLAKISNNKCVETKVTKNPYYENHQPGVLPGYIHELGANVMLSGGMGPKAVQMFLQYGIEVATGAVGRVESVLNAYLEGQLQGTVPCTHDHPESCGGH